MPAAAIDLRRLCENLRDLAPPPSPYDEHVVGAGLRAGHGWAGAKGSARFRLPRAGDTVDGVRAAVSAAIPGFDAAQTAAAWYQLLASPELVAEVEPPDPAELLAASRPDAASAPRDELRALALAVVVRAGPEGGPDRPQDGPVAAGTAVVVTRAPAGNPGATQDGWILASWTRSVNGFVRDLEGLWSMAGPSVRRQGRPRSAVLLTPKQTAVDESYFDAVAASLAVFGYSLRQHKDADTSFLKARQSLTSLPPALLVMPPELGEAPVLDGLLDDYFGANPLGAHVVLRSADPRDALPDLREDLAYLSGVTPSLHVVPPAEAITPAEQLSGLALLRARLDVEDRVRHPRFGHFVLNGGYWYTRDLDVHGGSCFKRYRKTGRHLVWDADLGADLDPIPAKHKGRMGRRILLAELAGAGNG